MKKTKLSIIVTIYNLENYIERCLNSLVSQTLEDIEILCINDGSTDNSQSIIDDFVKKYPNKVKSFIKENGGGDWGARNYGLKQVKSDYFIFVDGDDYVYPDYALKLYEAITTNKADMAVCAFERVDVATGKVVAIDMNKHGYKVFDNDGKDSLVTFINPGPCNKVYRYKKVKDNTFKAIRGSADLIFMLDSLLELEKIVIIPDVLYSYQMRYDSQIHHIKQHDIDVFKNEFLRIKKNYEKSKRGKAFIPILELMAFIHLGISLMYRVSYNNPKKYTKNNLKDMIKFLDTNFGGWRKSPFLKFFYCVKKGFKFFGLWGINIMYKWHMQYLFIKIYRFFIDKLKIDIKF